MLVLALDTTTRGGSCALLDDDVVVREQGGDPVRSHAERLPGDLIALLEGTGRSPDDVDVYAVAIGPGSFTGLRVGIATMQGLAFATGKPLIGASALDALAQIARAPRVATWVDAWRGEVYAALYEDGREVESPSVERPQTVLARLDDRPIHFIGDGAATYADAILRALPSATIAAPAHPLLASTIARIAADEASAGHRPSPHAIRALYVRRPDAEVARHARAER